MNAYIIGGAILAALGTILMTYGGFVQSRKDSAKSDETLETISRDLVDLKGKPKSDLPSDAIQRVESDIANWAKDFATKKQQRTLQVERQISEHQSSVDHSNELVRGYFAFLISVIHKAIAAYNADSATRIDLSLLPEVSPTLFSDPAMRYEGQIKFSPNVRWLIMSNYDPSSPDLAAPMFTIESESDDGKKTTRRGWLMLRFAADSKSFHLRLQQDFLLAVPIPSATKPTTEYGDTIKSILKSLIEFQLAQR